MELNYFKQQIQDNPFVILNDLVYEYILDQIVLWKIKPSERLKESKLAQELGVSRSPVRNALQKLLTTGLIYQDKNQNYFVTKIDPEDCTDLYVARKLIEGKAAFLAAQHITGAELERLKETVIRIEHAMNSLDLISAARWDEEFHQIIINASGNQYLKDMYACLKSRLLRYKYFLHSAFDDEDSAKQDFMKVLKRHRVILKALHSQMSIVVQTEIETDIDNMINKLYLLL